MDAQINLAVGWPNPKLLATTGMRRASADIFQQPNMNQWGSPLGYGTDEGSDVLRKAIAEWLTSFYQVETPINPENICITGGASQNLACLLQTFTDPIYTRNIWMVVPTYMCAARIFEDSGFAGRLRGVPEDHEGVDVIWLEQRIRSAERRAEQAGNLEPTIKPPRSWRKIFKHVIYAVPTFSNPSGKVMSLQRRESLVRIARTYDALIITDDVYDMVQWEESPSGNIFRYPSTTIQPRLVDVDGYLEGGPGNEYGNAVSNGSFSKIVGPGCRTGWAQGTKKLVYGISQTGSTRSGGAPSQFTANILYQFLKNSKQSFLAEELLPAYARRYKKMLLAIKEHLVPLGVTLPLAGQKGINGGFFIWMQLPSALKAEVVVQRALKEENLLILAGDIFIVDSSPTPETKLCERSIRLSFSWAEETLLETGILRLARVLTKCLACA